MKITDKVNIPYVASVTACFLFFSMGTTITWTSPTVPKLTNDTERNFRNTLTSDQISWIITLPTIGATVSGYLYTHIADSFGRKIAILSLGMPYLMPYIIMAFKKNIKMYYIARFVLGLAAGGTFSVVPMYIAEMSTKYNRANLGSIATVMICAGFLFSYSTGPWLSLTNFNLTLAVFPACFLILFFIFGHETVHFYLLKNQELLARQTLQKLRGENQNIDEEFEKINTSIKQQLGLSKIHFIRNKIFIKRFTSAVGLFIFQQLTGINALLMFEETIFQLSEIEIDSSVCCVILGIIQFISSFITASIGEKFGRKIFLIISAILMSIFLMCLGICFLTDFSVNVKSMNVLPIVLLSLFIVSYYIGFGSIPFVILSEILPWRVKSLAMSAACTIYWGTISVIVKNFDLFIQHLGLGLCFSILSFFCLVSVAFVHFCIEETQGKALEEIQDTWKI